MTFDKVQMTSNPRKKVTAGVFLLIAFILVWQIAGMFGRSAVSTGSKDSATAGGSVAVAQTTSAAPAAPTIPPPKSAQLAQPPMTDREMALMTLQQETQIKYLEALNELQMLKVSRDIAVTNKDISAAVLDKVQSEKKIVEMLSAPAVSPALSSTTTTTTGEGQGGPLGQQQVSYSLVSISQVQYRWAAVLAYGGTLYNVHVGDILPTDGATVIAISKDSVTLQQKDGVRKKVTLVSII